MNRDAARTATTSLTAGRHAGRLLPVVGTALLLAIGVHGQGREWPIQGPPRPLPARDIKFPPYEVQTLPNGLKVVAVLHHEQPLVNFRLLIGAGAAADPKDKLGLAHLLASLLDQGTTTKSAQEMADEIDFIGGAMGAGAGTDLTFVNLLVMKDSFEVGMRMLSEMARHPGFAQAEIDRQRQQMLSGLRVSLDDPEYVANSVFDRLVYGFHPYGLPDSGTPETLAAIARDDLIAFHARQFIPNNAILAIVGDVTADEAFNTARKVFSDWEKRELPAQTFIAPPDPTRRVIVVNKPDAVQTEVRVGHLGIPRRHPDYMAVNLAIRILGGEGSNRLHQVLRTQRGLTYGAQANMDTLRDTGDFEAETNTRSDATGEVLRLIVDEFWRLQRERVREVELADAKAYLTGSFPLTIETPEAIAMQVVNVLFYGLPLDQLQNFRERVNAVTADDIQRVARELLRPDRLSVVLVGNAKAFSSQLEGVGFGQFETVELGELDLTAANFKRAGTRAGGAGGWLKPPRLRWFGWPVDHSTVAQAFRPAVSGGSEGPHYSRGRALLQSAITAQEGDQAKALLDQAIRAKGGLDKLRAVKTIIARQTLSNPAVEGKSTETTNYIQYPDRFRIETRIPDGMIVQAYDGNQAWMKDPRGLRDAPELVREARASLRRDTIALLLAAKDGQLTPRLLPDVKDAKGRIDHALELSGKDLNPVILYIDPVTSLPLKQVYTSDAPGRPLVEEQFSDYREIDGIQIPFTAARRLGPQTVERRATEIRINVPIDAAQFKRPTS
jgi:zinc protease